MVLDDENKQYLINGARKSLDVLIEENGVDWFQVIDINPGAIAHSGEYTVKAGGSSWEGAGHITLLRNRANEEGNLEELIWIISFEERGPFSSVQINGKDITGSINGEYGGEAIVHIDMHNPQKMVFTYK